ncbi:MAG: maleylpyruvate isomerase family mycothiol-dependent enzyme [Flaviflexus sp.]|uniref:maleylpyruvate isomerase family mycothiol-dependent enzyme n=1 Tax=Flaviflexus sp. TaxID=1969482 RepID=UPI00352FA629
MSRTLADSLRWAEEGTKLFSAELQRLGTSDEAFTAPSVLPGWSIKHLVGHVGKNAEAIANLATWASTGVETPMYSSPSQRNADIEASVTKTPEALIESFESSAVALTEAWDFLSDEEWQVEVRTAQGRLVPASETPWMRTREVMVHSVDLGTGLTFADLAEDFLVALATDIVGKRSAAGHQPALTIAPTDSRERWTISGTGDSVTVTGSLANLTAWLAGRSTDGVETSTGELPTLPAWL